MDGQNPPSSKREALLALLERGLVTVHLDARKPGVDVPPHLRQEPNLPLNLSYRFYLPDLDVTDWGVRATLSFSGQGYTCRLPWDAIFAMRHDDESGWVWAHDLPPEILAALEARAARAEAEPARPTLAAVPAEPEGAPPEAAEETVPRKRPPPFLRLVE